MSSGRSSSSQGKPQFCFFLLAADGMRLLRMIHFLVLSQDFHLFADIALLLLMLATLSIRALSILIVVVLNSQSDNSRIYAISGCDECFISSSCLFFSFFFCFLVCLFSEQRDMMYWVKRTAVNRLLVTWWQVAREGKNSLVL